MARALSFAALVEETNAAIEQTESQASELDRIVEVFTLAEQVEVRTAASAPATRRPSVAPARSSQSAPAKSPVRSTVAKSYLSRGSAAVDKDWSEF